MGGDTPRFGLTGAVLTATIAVAAAIRFATLGDQSFWYDEALTVDALDGSLGQMWDELKVQGSGPLYYALAWVWVQPFGDGEVGLRSLSALAGVLTVPAAYVAAKELAGRRAGLIAAALVAASPPLVYYSQEARSYSLMFFLSAVSLAFFARARARSSPPDLAGWAIASILAFASNYFAACVVVPTAVLLVARSRARPVLAAVAAVGAGGLALAPLVLHQAEHGGVEWIAGIAFEERARGVVRVFTTGSHFPPPRLATVVLLAAAGLIALALWRGRADRRRGVLTALGVGVAAVLVALAGKALGRDYVLDRNLLVAWVPLAIAVAAGIDAALEALRARVPRAVLVGLPAALVVVAAFAYQVVTLPGDEERRRHDWRALARSLEPAQRSRVIVVAPFWQSVALRLYMPRMEPMPGPRRVAEIVVVSYEGPLPRAAPLARANPPAPFRHVSASRVDTMSVRRYRAPRPHVVAPEAITVEGTNGALPFYEPPP